ncbi:putative disease resistance protein RPP1 [Cardamine amara subsp. amara]|uniref:Disease resistance protein RPP1 n=1 Tax=Cardamine amara subsp. amara TaxID=228776 RepID=A0ABD1BXF3_CARAN
MDSSFFFRFCGASITFFTVLGTIFFMFCRKFKLHQENKTIATTTSSSLSHPSAASSFSQNWKHHVFPSFHGTDVRKTFLSHILKEFRGKEIDPFIDNNIARVASRSVLNS